MKYLSLLPAALLLAGCGMVRVTSGPSIDQQLADTQRNTGAPLTVTGPVTLPNGAQLAVFTYRKGTACGDGTLYVEQGRGSGGQGEGDCRPLSLSAGTLGTKGSILYGRVDQPGVAKVMVTFPNGEEHQATLGNGAWYIVNLNDSQASVMGHKVRALDADGKVLAEAP
jgi:hypothetical protein